MNNIRIKENAESLVMDWFKAKEGWLAEQSDRIWSLAEVKFEEYRSVGLLTDIFTQEGFLVKTGLIEGLETAFTAEWSNGPGPVVAFIGEYDALPDLGYEMADHPVPTGKSGHGCGHNLLGVGSMAAALAAKNAMATLGVGGTLKYFGCPAEEGGYAKVFMVRDGVFKGIDALLRWHPANATYVSMASCTASTRIKFEFFGKTAHAGMNPHLGRSALDAAVLTQVGINFLRERVPRNAKMFSLSIDVDKAGGSIPAHSELSYGVGAPRLSDVNELVSRMETVATGIAIATGTEVKSHRGYSSSEVLPNLALSRAMLKNLKKVGPPEYSEEERAFAKKLNEGLTAAEKAKSLEIYGIFDSRVGEKDLYDEISENMDIGGLMQYSTDSGDVSWQAPTSQMFVAAQTIGSPNHSWQQVVCSGNSIGHKAMALAGKTIALTALDILSDSGLLASAKEEYARALDRQPYSSPLPKDLKPGKAPEIR